MCARACVTSGEGECVVKCVGDGAVVAAVHMCVWCIPWCAAVG